MTLLFISCLRTISGQASDSTRMTQWSFCICMTLGYRDAADGADPDRLIFMGKLSWSEVTSRARRLTLRHLRSAVGTRNGCTPRQTTSALSAPVDWEWSLPAPGANSAPLLRYR